MSEEQLELNLDVPPVAQCGACGKHKEVYRMKEMPDGHFVCKDGYCEGDYKESVCGNYGH